MLGTQAQIWTEFLPTPERVRYVAYPRLCAFAEAAWCDGPRDYDEFRTRLARHVPQLVKLGALPAERAARVVGGLREASAAPGAPGEPARIGG